MRTILLILFILLWKFNVVICALFYPDYLTDRNAWDEWYYLRGKIYEVIFLLGVSALFFEEDRNSFFLKWVAFVVISASVVDKLLQNEHSEILRDYIIVYPFALITAFLVTKYKWKKI